MSGEQARRPVVLLLDDEAEFSALIVRSLGQDFEFEVGATEEEAAMLLGTRRFDVLLCDHMLPGDKQGLDFLVAALRRQPEAKRLLMTGYMNPELIARSTAVAQLSDVLLKPVTAAEIRSALHVALGLGA